MPATLTTALAAAALAQPIRDIYTAGKDRFSTELAKWGNARSISSLAKKVAAYEKVKTIWQRDKDVKLSSFYYPSKVTFHSEITRKPLASKTFHNQEGLSYKERLDKVSRSSSVTFASKSFRVTQAKEFPSLSNLGRWTQKRR
jgi:hypothetical protein